MDVVWKECFRIYICPPVTLTSIRGKRSNLRARLKVSRVASCFLGVPLPRFFLASWRQALLSPWCRANYHNLDSNGGMNDSFMW